ncbi:hypothetical protein CEXT_250541 [Caerostris extrusa]|uniref:Uncharacterized protein n=1 Tax=Caerostris extrusa TaxID=172846 RepID=A0AAV4YDX7_CAEEX|nr:hypothetical protein CEXT_250541 [Caerostris extrusa]
MPRSMLNCLHATRGPHTSVQPGDRWFPVPGSANNQERTIGFLDCCAELSKARSFNRKPFLTWMQIYSSTLPMVYNQVLPHCAHIIPQFGITFQLITFRGLGP